MAQVHYLVAERGRSDTRPATRPSEIQRDWLSRALTQPGGKLPLFDKNGKRIDPRTVRRCIEQGWAEPWFVNAAKPDWLVCKITESGRMVVRPR